MILPERVFGRLSPKRISFGFAIGPISFATQSRSCWAIFLPSSPVGPRPFRDDERHHRLAGQVVGAADDGGLGDERVGDERRLDLHRAEPVTRDVQHVVDPAHDGDVAVQVAARAVAGEVVLALEVLRVVALPVALRIAPDRPDHPRPRPLDHQDPALALLHRLAGLVDDLGHDPRQRRLAGAGLERRHARQRRDHVAAGLGLPPGIDDRAARFADRLVVPDPRLGIDRLADGAEDAQAGEVVLVRQVGPGLDQRADRGRRGVEHRDLVVLDHLPEPAGVGIGRHALEDDLGRAAPRADRRRCRCGR